MSTMHFYKGKHNQVEKVDLIKFYFDADESTLSDDDFRLLYLQNEIKKIFQIRNLNIFLGAGCSSLIEDGVEVGIPSINGLTGEVYKALKPEDKKILSEQLKINLESEPFSNNIEKTIELLQSFTFYLKGTKQDTVFVDRILKEVKSKIFEVCSKTSPKLIAIYQMFYKRIMLRDRALNTLSIATSNYDLYNEIALERSGIGYCNGFSGYHNRIFNPSTFNHIFAEDIGNKGKRLSPVENFAYLLKLHGSVSWFETLGGFEGLYKTKEIRPESLGSDPALEELMIYPSPMKQNASLGSPYSDIFREFQKRIMQEENLLVTIGYSFSDEHINNLIFQALSSSRFRLVIFGDVKGKIKELIELDDPRIWVIGGVCKGKKIHYFNEIVSTVLSSMDSDGLQEKMEITAKNLSQQRELK